MRALDAHGGRYSDWDPATELAYIIREEQSVHITILYNLTNKSCQTPLRCSVATRDGELRRCYVLGGV
jgi:hypothetical protein